ncbi:MAG: hypothetical protein GF350_13960 [Chitinivibrionales bacterium]|nr:hypothetical protein [Chitinivibrionales bacterium]
MIQFAPYLQFIRLQNACMAGGAVALGFWLSGPEKSPGSLILLIISAVTATGFGNVVNDIRDIETDAISHPERPLPSGRISPRAAEFFAAFLVGISLACAFAVSLLHGAATLIPCLFLLLYALFFKSVPLLGNILVSFLVAYPLLYGAIGSPQLNHLVIPAALAFLLNLMREIVKDFQDREGDRRTGITTTAVVREQSIKRILFSLTAISGILLIIPYTSGNFGIVYLISVCATIVPMHGYVIIHTASTAWKDRCKDISFLLKTELVCGLCALALDRGLETLL